MKLTSIDLFVMWALTTVVVLRPLSATSLSSVTVVTGLDVHHEDPSFNEVEKKSKSASADSDSAAVQMDNRIPVIFSELPDVERELSSDGSVIGSGEVKMANEHTQSTTSSSATNTRIAPKYMLDLYEKFSNDKYSYPMANIVRSFTNMNAGTIVKVK